MNPEFFDIETKKTFGIYPHDQMISIAMTPYLKRMRQEKIAVAVIGDVLGESVVDFLENNAKIAKINVVNSDTGFKSVFDTNTKPFKSKIELGLAKSKQRDVVCIDKSSCTIENLELYYQAVKSGGIFCGNGHETSEVKEALTQFRRKVKIGTPIQVCHRTIWFWIVR
jgi:hypothetical protein